MAHDMTGRLVVNRTPHGAPRRATQVDRYKQLLLKQRDIMIALTARLNERDEQILTLQEELEAYDVHQKCGKPALYRQCNSCLLLVLQTRPFQPLFLARSRQILAASSSCSVTSSIDGMLQLDLQPLESASCADLISLGLDCISAGPDRKPASQEAGGRAGPEDGGADQPAQGGGGARGGQPREERAAAVRARRLGRRPRPVQTPTLVQTSPDDSAGLPSIGRHQTAESSFPIDPRLPTRSPWQMLGRRVHAMTVLPGRTMHLILTCEATGSLSLSGRKRQGRGEQR